MDSLLRVSPQPNPNNDYVFVNNVRFISMAAVVALHSFGGVAPLAVLAPSSWLLLCALQLCKFGTIGFFLISGFLMGEGLTRRGSLEYLQRRIKTVLVPWLAWFALFAALSLINRHITGRLDDLLSGAHGLTLFGWMHDLLFTTAYWFVPNLLLAICVLLLCRRFLNSPWLGASLLLLSLFYGVNAYTSWIPVQHHTEALLGFVFYLWLGAWAARNFNIVERFIQGIPVSVLLALATSFGGAALWEVDTLARMGNSDPMNTLRISNQAYSVTVVLLIVKARQALWPRALNVRATTFGIYLSHSVVLNVVLSLARRPALQRILTRMRNPGPVVVVPMLLSAWIVVYVCSLAVTRIVASQPRLRWAVGSLGLRR